MLHFYNAETTVCR